MGNIRVRKSSGKLFFDFRYRGRRCREQTTLEDTAVNRQKLKRILERIEAEITLGSFDYKQYFPNSPMVEAFKLINGVRPGRDFPLLSDFAEQWIEEMSVQWRHSHYATVKATIKKHILPALGHKEVGLITKGDILTFRAGLAKHPGRGGEFLSPERINHIMTPLRMLLNEAADRFEFISPYRGIRSLNVPRTNVEPFSLEEVKLIIGMVRPDFRNYYVVRFMTGMRSSELHGLKWKYVDFANRQILVREALVDGRTEQTKTDGSRREIDMSGPVYEALRAQREVTGQLSEYVFCNRSGNPLCNHNVTNRVWYPLLRYLGLKRRRAYQTRHTAATLWLAAGENPEWIARQMGHTTTELLFRVYSRYVPNLTRQDGSAMERLLAAHGMVKKVDE